MRSIAIILLTIIAVSSFSQIQATIIHVPGDQPSIQAGIDASINGDTVLVAPGTYYEHIVFGAKAILLKSIAGAESTTIDGLGEEASLIVFAHKEDTNSVVDGFTFRNCIGSPVKCERSSPIIRNNIITNNNIQGVGGGIYALDHSSPIIENNKVISNLFSSGVLSYGHRGAIYCFGCCNAEIRNNIVTQNTFTWGSRGGIVCDGGSDGIISFNLVYDNTSTEDAGQIACIDYSSPHVVNNTIVACIDDENQVIGLRCNWGCDPTVVNNIFVDLMGEETILCALFDLPLVLYNDFWYCFPGCGESFEGCIYEDPLFCDPENGDYRLHSTSPCIGSGQDGANMGAFGIGCGIPGDANADGVVGPGDVVYLINYLFRDGSPPLPLDTGDCNCDGTVGPGDVVYLINYLFRDGPPPCER